MEGEWRRVEGKPGKQKKTVENFPHSLMETYPVVLLPEYSYWLVSRSVFYETSTNNKKYEIIISALYNNNDAAKKYS